MFTDYLNTLTDATNIRMIRTVIHQQSLLFQQERQKHLPFRVPGHLPAGALITRLGESCIARDCLVERNGTGLPKLDRFAILPGLYWFALELRCRRGGLSKNW